MCKHKKFHPSSLIIVKDLYSGRVALISCNKCNVTVYFSVDLNRGKHLNKLCCDISPKMLLSCNLSCRNLIFAHCEKYAINKYKI